MNNAIVVFAAIPNQETGPDYLYASDWQDFISKNAEPCGFWIASSLVKDASDLVRKIRSSPWWDRLVFTEVQTNALTDGILQVKDALQRGLKAEATKASLKLDPSSIDQVEKLMLYLYIRGEYELIPELQPEAKSLYTYPLLSLLGMEKDAENWLATLSRRGILEPARLVDRLRLCLHCGSAHLYFVDICPNCSSIEIKATSSLHCFACGHVARESEFEVEGGMICPKCQATLRHIGVDYDRPMAQYACGACHHLFVEPSVVARCLQCGSKDNPEKLDVVEIHTLKLSSHGREMLRMKQIHESFSALENANYIVTPFFRQMVSWAVVTQERHNELFFSLILVQFLNPGEIVDSFGATHAYLMLDEFARRLREMLRASDVTTRTTEEKLWIFLPFTHPEGFAARLKKLVEEVQPDRGIRLEIDFSVFYSPRDCRKGDTADLIMQRM